MNKIYRLLTVFIILVNSTAKAQSYVGQPPLSKIAIFAFLANANFNMKFNNEAELRQQLTAINKSIETSPLISKVIGKDWKVVFGPYAYDEKKGGLFCKKYFVSHNTLYAAKGYLNPEDKNPTIVVAISGTNKLSTYEWWEEDFDVSKMLVLGSDTGVKVTRGTIKGLKKLMAFEDGNGVDIFDFLFHEVVHNNCNVVFTGHSLGGALAPALGYLFADSFNNKFNRPLNIVIHSIAGPKVFNEYGATRIVSITGDNVYPMDNTKDIVPNSWVDSNLASLPYIYTTGAFVGDKNYTWKSSLIPVLNYTRKKILPNNFSHYKTKNYTRFSGLPNEDNTHPKYNYLNEAQYQHFVAYIKDGYKYDAATVKYLIDYVRHNSEEDSDM